MVESTRTFRVFVSSTFSDLKAERDALQETVFPRLRELCQAHGCRFQGVDLRWGVSEEAALDQQTMKICLSEIARCQRISPRPNFIVLLGDRYGWRPLPYEIPASEFEPIVGAITDPRELQLLDAWYRRDDNAIPPTYCLVPRTGEYADAGRWASTERTIRDVLERVVPALRLPPERLRWYTSSATEQEITAGALGVPDAGEHVFCYFRLIEDLPAQAAAAGFLDADEEGHPDRESASRLQDLKRTLRERLPANVHEYEATWTDNGPSLSHLETLCQDVYDRLANAILTEIEQLEAIDILDSEISAHQAFGRARVGGFVGRLDALDLIQSYLRSADKQPLAIWGDSGCGKTALMARAAQQATQAYPGAHVISRFIGATPESSNIRILLEGICREIERVTKSDNPSMSTEPDQRFAGLLRLATTENPIFVFLDALDQLSEVDVARELAWLPHELPNGSHVVLSTLPGDCLAALQGFLPDGNLMRVEPLSLDEVSRFLDEGLTSVARRLQPSQHAAVLGNLGKCRLPLYSKLVFEEVCHWKSYDPIPEQRYGETGRSTDIRTLIRDLFARLSSESSHGRWLVARSLGYLVASKNGLSEDELVDLLSADELVGSEFTRRSPQSPLGDRLPSIVWSRLLFDLEPYLAERSADGTTVITYFHSEVRRAAEAEYLSGRDGPALHAALADYYLRQAPQISGESQTRPNLRRLSELPFQQAHGERWEELASTLCSLDFVQSKCLAGMVYETMTDYVLATDVWPRTMPASLLGRLMEFERFLRANIHRIAADPDAVFQLAANQPEGTQPALSVESFLSSGRVPRPYFVFAPRTGETNAATFLHGESVDGCAWTPDGKRLVTTSHDGLLRIWDALSGREIHRKAGIVEDLRPTDLDHNLFNFCALSPGGRWLAFGSRWNELYFADITDLSSEPFRIAHTGYWPVSWSPDGNKIAAPFHGRLRVLDVPRRELIDRIKPVLCDGDEYELGCAWSTDGSHIATSAFLADPRGGGTSKLELRDWDSETGQGLSSCDIADERPLCWSPDAESVLTLALGRRPRDAKILLRLRSVRTAEERRSVDVALPAASELVDIRAAWSRDGERIALLLVWFRDALPWLSIWDTKLDRLTQMPIPHTAGRTPALTWAPNGRSIAVAGRDVEIWDAEAVQSDSDSPAANRLVYFAGEPSWSPDESKVAISNTTMDGEQSLEVRDSQTGKRVGEARTPRVFHDLLWSVDGTSVLQPMRPGPGLVSMDVRSGRVLRKYDEAELALYPEILSRDMSLRGRTVSVIRHDQSTEGSAVFGSARLDRSPQSLVRSQIAWLDGVRGEVAHAWAPDQATLLVVAEEEGRVLIGPSRGSRSLARVLVHPPWGDRLDVTSCLWSPDGRKAALSATWRNSDPRVGSYADHPSYTRQIIVVDVGSGGQATARPAGWSPSICGWSPDLLRLTVQYSRRGEQQLEILDLASGARLCAMQPGRDWPYVLPNRLHTRFAFVDGANQLRVGAVTGIHVGIPSLTVAYQYRPDLRVWGTSPECQCPWCCAWFSPRKDAFEAILDLNRDLAQGESPCLKLPAEAWDDPRLAWQCPACHQPVRINPFVVDNRYLDESRPQ